MNEKEKRLGFQAEYDKLKEKVPALKGSQLLVHLGQCNRLTALLDFSIKVNVWHMQEDPNILVSRIRHSLRMAADEIERNIEILKTM